MHYCVQKCTRVELVLIFSGLELAPSDEPRVSFHPRVTNSEMLSFYARKQNASRVFAIVWAPVHLSVRPSVCLFVRLTRS